MSGLAALLAGRQQPGIYQWHAGFDVPDVRHAVEHAGWAFGHVDGLRAQTRDEFLAAVGDALSFPEGYAQNFDSLGDYLADVDGGEGTVLLWDAWGPWAREDPQAFSVALSVLGTRVNAERGSRFAVLLRGEGPPVPGVASLD